jgi:hypothetical protein
VNFKFGDLRFEIHQPPTTGYLPAAIKPPAIGEKNYEKQQTSQGSQRQFATRDRISNLESQISNLESLWRRELNDSALGFGAGRAFD